MSPSAPIQTLARQPSDKPQAAGCGTKSEAWRPKRRTQPRRRHDAGSNNSMPIAVKPYSAPEPPEDVHAYDLHLVETAKQYREAFRLKRNASLTVYIHVRRQNYEQLLWHFLSNGTFTKSQIYSPKNLPYWTVSLRLRIKVNYALGKVMETIKHRLGIMSPNLKFCLDGFYGMVNYVDAFGNAGACPWMELSNFSTVKSLGLQPGDSIYLCMATQALNENVRKWRLTVVQTAAPARRTIEESGQIVVNDGSSTESPLELP